MTGSLAAGILVLGIGNLLLRDDGVGVEAARLLAGDLELPGGTEVVDGGTGGLALLPLVAAARELVVVDAVELQAEPGTVRLLVGAEIGEAYQGRLTAHEVGASDLFSAARLTGVLPAEAALVGVQPACLGTGVGLTPVVAGALPEVVGQVRRRCRYLAACGSSVHGPAHRPGAAYRPGAAQASGFRS